MIVEIVYKGLGKLENWYGLDDYYKERTFRGVQALKISGSNVLIRMGKEDIEENLEIIESMRVVEPL